MKRTLLIMAMVFSVFVTLHGSQAQQTQSIANVTIPFSGASNTPEQTRALIASAMKSLLAAAKEAGASTIRLQSSAYTFTPVTEAGNESNNVQGNLFIDIVPPSKTADFVTALQKTGTPATINYFQYCHPR